MCNVSEVALCVPGVFRRNAFHRASRALAEIR